MTGDTGVTVMMPATSTPTPEPTRRKPSRRAVVEAAVAVCPGVSDGYAHADAGPERGGAYDSAGADADNRADDCCADA